MNETVKEWVRKSEGDFRVAGRELKEAEEPYYDAICFHSQQCIEKLIKGILIHLGSVPPRIHDIVVLSRMLRDVASHWEWDEGELRFLSLSAVAFRYPGESAEKRDAESAYEICTRIRERLLKLLG